MSKKMKSGTPVADMAEVCPGGPGGTQRGGFFARGRAIHDARNSRYSYENFFALSQMPLP